MYKGLHLIIHTYPVIKFATFSGNYPCNDTYYKCPGFYCIPWRYVCDGMIHCPGGLEEDVQSCNRTSCPGQFACYNTSICIHPESTCNDYTDCPNGDDEFYCSFTFPNCPNNCLCVLFSFVCSKVEDMSLKGKHFPYINIHIIRSNLTDLKKVFKLFKQILLLNISQNSLNTICDAFKEANSHKITTTMTRLDASQNKLRLIQDECFQQMSSLAYLNLSRNHINKVGSSVLNSSFVGVIIDLSFNKITSLVSFTFPEALSIRFLDVSNNPIIHVSQMIFSQIKVSMIQTSSYKVCCVKPDLKTLCMRSPPWPNSCTRLLMDISVQITMAVVGFLGVFLNKVVFIVKTVRRENDCYDVNVILNSNRGFIYEYLPCLYILY